MDRIEELEAEIEILHGEVNAAVEAMLSLVDNMGTMLEVTGVISRATLAEAILSGLVTRRAKGEGSSVELAMVERGARRLLQPTAVTVKVERRLDA